MEVGHANGWVENDAQMLVWENDGQASNAQVEEGAPAAEAAHLVDSITLDCAGHGVREAWASRYVVVSGVVPSVEDQVSILECAREVLEGVDLAAIVQHLVRKHGKVDVAAAMSSVP